jgi:type IV fimbrial biogenesis protein FimT
MNCGQRQPQCGLSLIEAMITLSIATVVMGIGVPAIGGWMRDAEVRATAEALRAGLQLARLEAVQRNTVVRFSLTNPGGLATWTLGCVSPTAQCPAVIRQSAAGDTGRGARIGVATSVSSTTAATTAAASNLSEALEGGSGLPAGVSFDSAGRVPLNNLGSDIVRIDITHARNANAQRLVVRIGGAGLVSLCDPAASPGRLEVCL